MADVWQFSPSSLPLLETCKSIAAQGPFTVTEQKRKWLELFKPSPGDVPIGHIKLEEISCDSEDTIIIPPTKNEDESEKIEAKVNQVQHALVTTNRIDHLLHSNEIILPILAEKLPKVTTDHICKQLFERDLDEAFVNKFFTLFLPVHVRKTLKSVDESSSIVDMLVNALKTYPNSVHHLVEALITDTEVPSKILEEFFLIDTSYCDRLLQHLSAKELPPQAFIHHLNAISCLYKHSEKSFDIQNFILTCLVSASDQCTTNKVYGRFMLTFFQTLKENEEQVNKLLLERVLKCHETLFKNPCLNIFKNL